MGDLVARLRKDADCWAVATNTFSGPCTASLEREAADEIERLTDEAATYCKWWREQRDRVKELESALAAEREECAKVAEEISPLTAGKAIAAAIRARGQK